MFWVWLFLFIKAAIYFRYRSSYIWLARATGWSEDFPDSKVHGANMGPTWGRQNPGGPMLAPWTLLSGFPIWSGNDYYFEIIFHIFILFYFYSVLFRNWNISLRKDEPGVSAVFPSVNCHPISDNTICSPQQWLNVYLRLTFSIRRTSYLAKIINNPQLKYC